MAASISKPLSMPALAAHWAGCLLGTALVVLFAVMALGQGPPAELLVSPLTVSLIVMLFGFAVAWWNDLVGGVVSLLGIASFYVLNYADTGQLPSGWVFPLCFVPGVMLIVASLLRRAK